VSEQRHEISERRSPTHILVFCTCGWRHEVSRRQNALGRAAKARAAVNRHLQAVVEIRSESA
jgi:hypothetical protein